LSLCSIKYHVTEILESEVITSVLAEGGCSVSGNSCFDHKKRLWNKSDRKYGLDAMARKSRNDSEVKADYYQYT
jgi:hypothetical protein